MKIRCVPLSALETLEDPRIDERLLPENWRRGDNSRRVRHCRTAVKNAIKNCITSEQRRNILLHYGQGLSGSEIARSQGRTCSSVTKSLRAGERSIREYVELYMEIYDTLEQEWLGE